MIVTVTSADVELSDADNLKQFHLSARPPCRWPRSTPSYAAPTWAISTMITPPSTSTATTPTRSPGFVDAAAFNRMVEYATSKQWISAAGSAVRAHIV
jgi:hypothetical protein